MPAEIARAILKVFSIVPRISPYSLFYYVAPYSDMHNKMTYVNAQLLGKMVKNGYVELKKVPAYLPPNMQKYYVLTRQGAKFIGVEYKDHDINGLAEWHHEFACMDVDFAVVWNFAIKDRYQVEIRTDKMVKFKCGDKFIFPDRWYRLTDPNGTITDILLERELSRSPEQILSNKIKPYRKIELIPYVRYTNDKNRMTKIDDKLFRPKFAFVISPPELKDEVFARNVPDNKHEFVLGKFYKGDTDRFVIGDKRRNREKENIKKVIEHCRERLTPQFIFLPSYEIHNIKDKIFKDVSWAKGANNKRGLVE
jgi:hypothetical protein